MIMKWNENMCLSIEVNDNVMKISNNVIMIMKLETWKYNNVFERK
jgi:hypothetical protein